MAIKLITTKGNTGTRVIKWKTPLDAEQEKRFKDDEKLLKFCKKLMRQHPKELPGYFLKVTIETV